MLSNGDLTVILLTGATGFLGSAILEKLLASKEEVIAIKRITSSTARIRMFLPHPGLHLLDINDKELAQLFKKYRIDTIIHTATEYGRGATPLYQILNANLLLPLQLAEMGIQYGVKCFINTDSFFNKGSNSYSSLLNYSLSKKSLLNWLEKLAENLKIINVVLEHMYGPGDNPHKFVEQMIVKIGLEKVPNVSLTHGHQRRDFIFIDDVVQAYLLLVEYGRSEDFRFKSFGLGTGSSIQIRDFVDQIKIISGSQTNLGYGEIPYRPDEIMASQADNSRLKHLGWSPMVDYCDGIGRILKHHWDASEPSS